MTQKNLEERPGDNNVDSGLHIWLEEDAIGTKCLAVKIGLFRCETSCRLNTGVVITSSSANKKGSA